MRENEAELARLFSRAEGMGKCLAPSRHCDGEMLRRRAVRGDVVRPVRGMYARLAYWGALSKPQRQLHVMRTMQELHPDWVFCHESAAVAFGLPVSYDRLDRIHVATTRKNRNASTKDIRWHVVEGDEPECTHGIRVTSLPRTVFDCMRTAGFGQALAVADGALRASGRSPGSFVSCFERFEGGFAGLARAVRAMRHADARSESGGESIARAAMIQQGFALPELQVAFPQPLDENRFFRVDYLWTRMDGSKVAGEFDGMQKYEDPALLGGRSSLHALIDERHRESQLTLYGMPIVRFTYQDVANGARFRSLLERYGIPRSEDVARFERRLERSRSTTAQIFTVCELSA